MLGAARVGKSTFMQRALDLNAPPSPNAPVSARKMSVDGQIYVVRLFELGFDQVEFGGNDEDDGIVWPEELGDLALPRIDGALTLYDVTNQKSLAEVPGVLSKFGDIRFSLRQTRNEMGAHIRCDRCHQQSVTSLCPGFL